MGDWSYRLGEPDLWWAPEIYNLLDYDPGTFKITRDAVMRYMWRMGRTAFLIFQLKSSAGIMQSVDVKVERGDGSIGDVVVMSKALVGEGGEVNQFFRNNPRYLRAKASGRANLRNPPTTIR